ncbi:hypothetical protein Trydic_g8363 [Trypoxylus dichotomus]
MEQLRVCEPPFLRCGGLCDQTCRCRNLRSLTSCHVSATSKMSERCQFGDRQEIERNQVRDPLRVPSCNPYISCCRSVHDEKIDSISFMRSASFSMGL